MEPIRTPAERLVGRALHLLRWIVSVAVAAAIIGIGRQLPILRRLDELLAPYRPTLHVVLLSLGVLGFVIFMASAIRFALMPSATRPRGEISFGELRQAWRNGTWRGDRRVRVFLGFGSGAILAMGSAVAYGVVFADPGLKLLCIAAAAYVAAQLIDGFRRAPVPR